MGTSSIVYVSIADTTTTCANLELPTLPTGYTYNCATAANLKKADGTGWIPVNFKQITFGAPLSNLPIDPINTTSSRNYYTYVTGGSWELSTPLESAKNKMGGSNDKVSTDGGTYPDLYETGSKTSLLPIDYGDPSLVGYWNFEEGPNATSTDYSGNGNNGTWNGTSTQAQHYTTGKVGSYAGNFNGGSDYLNVLTNHFPAGASSWTVSAWIYYNSTANFQMIWFYGTNGTAAYVSMNHNCLANVPGVEFWGAQGVTCGSSIALGTWNHIAVVYDGTKFSIYTNGQFSSSNNATLNITNGYADIGAFSGGTYFNGSIDAVRIYNRALSAAEVSALYNATR